jgi:muramoyltetrapeptide carboxypeptidase
VNLKGENNIVLAVRGGYGASRLLESIDWQGLAKRQQQDPLLICGHSDFTVIQLGLLALHNVITFSGPMLAGNFGAPELDAFTRNISGARCATRPTASSGKATGRLGM